MKRINFTLIRLEEDLAAARQCIVCLFGMVLLNLAAALAYRYGVMTPLLALIWIIGAGSFGLASVICAYLPEWRAQRLERDRLTANEGSNVEP